MYGVYIELLPSLATIILSQSFLSYRNPLLPPYIDNLLSILSYFHSFRAALAVNRSNNCVKLEISSTLAYLSSSCIRSCSRRDKLAAMLSSIHWSTLPNTLRHFLLLWTCSRIGMNMINRNAIRPENIVNFSNSEVLLKTEYT